MSVFVRRMNSPLFSVLVVCGTLLISGCNAVGRTGSGSAIGDLAFSPDGGTLVFREIKTSGAKGLGFLDLATGERNFFSAPDGYLFQDPNYSPNGEQLVAAMYEASGNTPSGQSQIVIMDEDGGNIRELTVGPGCRNDPSFSPKGDRLLFIFSPPPEQKGGRKCQHQDIYELDIASKQIVQLTDFSLYSAIGPQYLPDGERFVFSGDGPKKNASPEGYIDEYGKNEIFIMGRGKNEFHPAFKTDAVSFSPSISADNKLVYLARTNEIDGIGGKYNYDIFLRVGDQDHRLTELSSYIVRPVISSDGKRVAFLMDSSRDRDGVFELMIMNSDGSGVRGLGIYGRFN